MQGGRAFSSLTVHENLSMAAAGPAARKEGLYHVLEVFPKLKEISGRRAGLLSGGERQSLALAMTLVRRPTVLLLDEPSAGLSPRLVGEMLDKVRDVGQTWAVAVCMVEQNVQAALRVADRCCALANGEVAMETSRPCEWLVQGRLDALFLGAKSAKPGVSAHAAVKSDYEGES
jgi:ABC-type branched-subunit amino acid transport system ATPase component